MIGSSGNLKEAVHYDFSDEEVRDFWTKGHMVFRGWKGWAYGKKLKKTYYDEFFKLDVLGSVHKFKKPILIIHGQKDNVVPAKKDPLEIYANANEPKKLVIIKDGDHRFLEPKKFNRVISEIDSFIRR